MPIKLAGRLRAALVVVATLGCQNDSIRPDPAGNTLTQVTATYVCANTYDVENSQPATLTVHYQVLGTPEAGELILAPASATAPSLTRLVTLRAGDLVISADGKATAPFPNSGVICSSPPAWPEPQASTGEWSAGFSWPVVAVHLHLLPDGQILSWGRIGDPYLWNPESGAFVAMPISTMVFCSGHTFLPDGRLLVTGGHISDEHGLPDANLFDAATTSWTPLPPMHWGRWYPTSTTLPDGHVVTLGGKDQNGTVVDTPELWSGSDWYPLTGASRALPYYPRTFVAPNGLLFYAGELPQTAYLDVSGAGSWVSLATSNYGRRDYGSAVMYQPGQVMIVGGSDPPDGTPTNTAEVIDLNQASPTWRYTASMSYARRHLNATMLPDGRVVVTGGTTSAGFSDPAGSVHAAEMWDPTTETWTLLASNSVNRVYHSTTLLLPDGRLLHTGSGDGLGLSRELNAELYSPPYLFKGPRPVVSDVPDATGYGEQFSVTTPDAGTVVRVTLIRLSSVTHAFDESQRFLELTFRRSAGGLTVTAPASGALAPPGPYMMFLVNDVGVPSIARILRVG